MERRNARSVLGNHDLFLLVMLERSRGGDQLGHWRTRDGLSIEDLWLSRRGDWADLNAVASDADLEAWLRALPVPRRARGRDPCAAHRRRPLRRDRRQRRRRSTRRSARWLATRGGAFQSLRYTIGRHGFDDPDRLRRYLEHFGVRRVVHGHTPHWDAGADRRCTEGSRSATTAGSRASGAAPRVRSRGRSAPPSPLLPPLPVGRVDRSPPQGWRLSISPSRATGGSCPAVT